MLYDGFISYSHAREAAVARAIQSALHRFARPWYRMRALRIFRDVTNLSANPGLWSAIEKALSEARFFLLLASPQSAASPWVQREVEWWLRNRQADHLLLVLVDGGIQWDDTAGDFNWTVTTVLPRGLAGAFREEPLYIDFRGLTPADDLSLANPLFSDRIASLSAALHGRSKDEMIGEDVRQHRRTMRVAWSAVAALAVLAGTAATAAFVAVQQRNVAREQRTIAEERQKLAEAREIVARAELLRSGRPELHPAGLLLAAEGLKRLAAVGAPTWEADQAVRRALSLTPTPLAAYEMEDPVTAFAFNADGTRLAAGTRRGLVRIWTDGAREPFEYAHGDYVAGLAFSPDGALLASASWDGAVGLAETKQGSVLATLQHPAAVWSLAFSPDGMFLVTGGRDGIGRVWNVRSRREVSQLRHGGLIAGVRFSGDGRLFVLQGADGVASVFDVAAGKRLTPVGHPHNQLEAAVLSPDGRRLATRSQDETFLLDVAAEKQIARISERSSGPFTWGEGVNWTADAVAFSADGRWLYTANRDRSARMIDASTGAVVRSIPHDLPVRGVAATADGKGFATRSGSVVRLWDSASGEETARFNHEGNVTHVAFASTGGRIATVAGRQIRLWHDHTGDPLLRIPHVRGTWERVFSPDGRWLVSQDPLKVISIWEASSARRVAQLPHPDLIRNARFSHDGGLMATACNDGTVRVWELPSERVLAALAAPKLPLPLVFSRGGTLIATVSNGDRPDEPGMVQVWEWRSGRQVFRQETKKECRDLAMSPDEQWIAFADAQPSLHVVPLSGKGNAIVLDGHAIGTESFSADGRSLLAWRERTVALIDLQTGKPSATVEVDTTVRLAALAARSGRVAIVGAERGVHLWNGRAGGGLTPLAHELSVNSARFSADERWLVTGSGHPISGRGEVRIWSAEDGRLAVALPHERGAWVVDFNPDASRVAAISRDLPTHVWLASRAGLLTEVNARATRNLTYDEWRQFMPAMPYSLLCDGQPVHASVPAAAAEFLLDGNDTEGLRLCERIVALSAPGKGRGDVREEAARLLVARSGSLAKEGNVARALRAVERARELDRGAQIAAETWNAIAWAGATQGKAREVFFAAERAIQLDPGNINYLDTRGLIRALTGDTAGAVEDFKAFVAGAKNYPKKMVDQRHLWLAALVLGRNPFTDEVLTALRNE